MCNITKENSYGGQAVLPANVEADCCKVWRTPRQQPYFLQTTLRGTSRTKSCSANAV